MKSLRHFYNIKLFSNINKFNSVSLRRLSDSFKESVTPVVEPKETENSLSATKLIEFHGKWPETEKKQFLTDMLIFNDFISVDEETKLFEEIEPYMKRMRYEFDHWDDAIHGFRETERKNWYPHNRQILERVRKTAFEKEIMPYIHILDLAENGVIKPHVDSTRYCGSTIAGMSLLSDSVMRLVRTDETKYNQQKQQQLDNSNKEGTDNSVTTPTDDTNYRNQPLARTVDNFYADIFLKRRSLYVMSHSARYNFTHEILSKENSKFAGQDVLKNRRISIICRNEP